MKWIVTIEIDDPTDLIPNFEFAMGIVEGLLVDTQGHEIAENCSFKVTDAQLIPPEVKRDPENLGVQQKGLLTALREHGNWHKVCGWFWNDRTEKILDSLVRRGLVQKDAKGVYTAL